MHNSATSVLETHKVLGQWLESLSGHWAVHLESRVPPTELYEARFASAKPSLGFFILGMSSAVIASIALISNSTAVVIGAMIVAPLMDPIFSLAFGLGVSDGKLIRRSAVTIGFGVLAVVGTASLISWGLGSSHVQSEITGRRFPNLIDLGIAVPAAVAGSVLMNRKQLANSIAGVAIAVDNKARLDHVLNASDDLLNQSLIDDVYQKMLKRGKDFGLSDLEVNISVIPHHVYKFDR